MPLTLHVLLFSPQFLLLCLVQQPVGGGDNRGDCDRLPDEAQHQPQVECLISARCREDNKGRVINRVINSAEAVR